MSGRGRRDVRRGPILSHHGPIPSWPRPGVQYAVAARPCLLCRFHPAGQAMAYRTITIAGGSSSLSSSSSPPPSSWNHFCRGMKPAQPTAGDVGGMVALGWRQRRRKEEAKRAAWRSTPVCCTHTPSTGLQASVRKVGACHRVEECVRENQCSLLRQGISWHQGDGSSKRLI